MNEELVSIIIPSYNRETLITRSAQSVLNQTYKNIEVIIVDDGSTDNTSEVVSRIRDNRVRYIKQKNSGACVARNHGIDEAKGRYIAFQDSDDVWHQDKLKKQMDIFGHWAGDVVFCKLDKISDDGTIETVPGNIHEGELKKVDSLFGIGTQSLIGKKEVFNRLKFDPEFPRFQDMELMYRIIKDYQVYCLDEGLVDYYIGKDSISSNPLKLLRACELIEEKHPNLIKEYPAMGISMARSLQLGGKQLKKQKDIRYKQLFKKALEFDPSMKARVRGFSFMCGF